jgi:ribonuclease HI
LLLQPKVLTKAALAALSRGQTVVAFVDGSAGIPADWGGLGIVLKFGRYVVEIAEPITPPATSYFAELCAIERALDLLPLNQRMVIRTDCQNLVTMLNGAGKARKIPYLIARVQKKLFSSNATLKFIAKRKGNSQPHPHNRADRLASKARLDGAKIFRISAA